jgi:hypothetical protein
MLQQWNNTYQTGKKAGPRAAVISAGAYWFLAYKSYQSYTSGFGSGIFGAGMGKVWSYVVAGALVLGIAPYTILFMNGTNGKLLSKYKETQDWTVKKEVSTKENESVHYLVDTWGLLNLGRGMLVVASGVLGAWTALN